MSENSVDCPMLPAEATDSPIWKHLQKRGHVDIHDSPTAGVAPLNIYYEIYGSGAERIVFVTGMRADHQMWEANVEQMLKLGNYQCLVYDHRGTGHSDSGGGMLSITTSNLASDMKKLMTTLGWSKANIVGVSLGGMIALEFACNNAEMVKTLTLGATTSGFYIPPLTSIVDSVRIACSQNKKAKLTNICLSNYAQDHLTAPAPSDSGCNSMLEYYLAVAKRKSKYKSRSLKSTSIGQLLSVFRHKVSPARLSVLGSKLPNKQILILVGSKDRIIDPADSAYLADCIGRQKVIFESFEDAEHAIHVQGCERFVDSIHSMISTPNNQNSPHATITLPDYSPDTAKLFKMYILWESFLSNLSFHLSILFLSLSLLVQFVVCLM